MTKQRIERVGDVSVRVYSPDSSVVRGSVVLVHGICMSSKIWQRWGERLASRGIEAWCVDLRGHGESAGRDEIGQARIEDYAADVEAVLDAANAHVVIGHDMGGLVAQLVATRRELRGLVLVGTVAPRGLTGRSSFLLFWRELRPRYVRAILQGKAWQPSEADISALACGKLTPEDRAEVLSWLQPESGVAAREMSISGVAIDDTKVRCPVLVAATTLDILTPPARQRMVASFFRADYVEFAQHAHFPMLEPGWERPVAVIGRWLEEAARIGDTNRGSASRMSARRNASATSSPLPLSSPLPSLAVSAPAASAPAVSPPTGPAPAVLAPAGPRVEARLEPLSLAPVRGEPKPSVVVKEGGTERTSVPPPGE